MGMWPSSMDQRNNTRTFLWLRLKKQRLWITCYISLKSRFPSSTRFTNFHIKEMSFGVTVTQGEIIALPYKWVRGKTANPSSLSFLISKLRNVLPDSSNLVGFLVASWPALPSAPSPVPILWVRVGPLTGVTQLMWGERPLHEAAETPW